MPFSARNTRGLFFAAVISLWIFSAIAASAQNNSDWTQEEIDRIRAEAVPMPFPDLSHSVVVDTPPHLVYKYDPADVPAPAVPASIANAGRGSDTPKAEGPLAVDDTTAYPYSAVVLLYMQFGDYYAGCSGAFIYNTGTILTAGHCVYDHETGGGLADAIMIIPAMNGSDRPFGAKSGRNWATSDSWISSEDYTQDWGVISVDVFEGDTGYMGSTYTTDRSWYMARQFETAGYPGESPYTGDVMWWDIGRVDQLDSRMIQMHYRYDSYNYYCIPGQSGSPIFINESGQYSIAAVLTLSDCEGPRINNTISSFVSQFNCTGCYFDNTCYEDGTVNPENSCQACDASQDPTGWTAHDFSSCDDGVFCNGSDQCQGGACVAHLNDACESYEACDEDTQTCSLPPMTPEICGDLITKTYSDCGQEFMVSNQEVTGDQAYSLCVDQNGPWDCIYQCVHHPSVTNCDEYASCLEEACSVSFWQDKADTSDDDDNDTSSPAACGC